MQGLSVCECVLLGWGSVLVCSLSPQLRMLFPPGWRLGLTVLGGTGMGGKGAGGEGSGGEGGNIREHTPEPGCWLVVEGVPKGQRCRKEKQMRGLETGCCY